MANVINQFSIHIDPIQKQLEKVYDDYKVYHSTNIFERHHKNPNDFKCEDGKIIRIKSYFDENRKTFYWCFA